MKTITTSLMTFFVTIGTQMGLLNVTKELYVVKPPTTRWKMATYYIIKREAKHGSRYLTHLLREYEY